MTVTETLLILSQKDKALHGFQTFKRFQSSTQKTQRLQLSGERGPGWHSSLSHLETPQQQCEHIVPTPRADSHDTSREKKKKTKGENAQTRCRPKESAPLQPLNTQQDKPGGTYSLSCFARGRGRTPLRGEAPAKLHKPREVVGLTHSSESCGVKGYVGIKSGLLEFHSRVRNAL